jgi:hypothetical protein
VVGHYLGCGWDIERILAHLEQHPYGIGERYLREGRLAAEIARSAGKYVATALPLSGNGGWSSSWEAKAPQPEAPESLSNSLDSAVEISRNAAEQHVPQEPCQESPHENPELPDDDPELLDDEDLDETEDLKPAPDLPPMYAHGDPDPRPLKSWLVKGLIPACGHGLLAGQ